MFEYSLTAAAILYELFSHAIRRKQLRTTEEEDDPDDGDFNAQLPSQVGVDFNKAHTGLFFGVLLLAGIIISIILFFNELRNEAQYEGAKVAYYVSDITSSLVLSFAVFVGMYQLRHFSIDNVELNLDDLLLILGLLGSFLFDCFTGYAAICMLIIGQQSIFYTLSIVNSITSFVLVVSQTIFIIDALRRYAGRKVLLQTRPGRSAITFLVIANIAMWLFKTFQLKEAEMQSFPEKFFGAIPWSLMTHACLPIMMFYRFHAAACLAEIWYTAYSKRKQH